MKILPFIIGSIFLTATLSAQKIVIKGSDTLGAKLVPQLAEQFRADNSGVTFEIAAEGSSTGITAIIDGTADIGMSSRNIKREELSKAALNGREVKEITVGFDGIAVIVNVNNPVDALSMRQIERIFTGDVTDWSALRAPPGPISVYTRNTASGTYATFKELVMRKRDYGQNSQKMAGNEQIAAEVSKNTFGIGYVGMAYVDTPGIKVLRVNGLLPNELTIRTRQYPIARPLFYYIGKEPEGTVADFIAFTLSSKGQNIVKAVHFIPLEVTSDGINMSDLPDSKL